VKILLYEWIKKNRVMLVNAGSLIGTTVVTGTFGFAYWWIAARQYPPQAVGLASAAVSAMTLLGAICILGLGTLLIGELPRHPGKEASLISAALILVGSVGACGGSVFVLVAPLVSTAFLPFRANIGIILLFAVGVSLTAIINVLDAALIGLLKGNLQFWRNALFAVAKLVVLMLASFWLVKVGEIVYGTWVLGIILSLVPLARIVIFKVGRSGRSLLPDWTLLHKLRSTALEHHALNLILQLPGTTLPVLVTILLSATTNAWFYVSWMISGLVFIASYALTTVLFAINAGQTDELMHKIRITLGLALITSLLCNCLLLFEAPQILALFGHNYAQQAAWCLRILGLGAFPVIIMDHYMAVSRIYRKVAQTALPIATVGCVLELGMAALGAHFGGLVGLSLGWDVALCVQAVVMFPTVYRAAFPVRTRVKFEEGTIQV
jgi:O-antigen/teichoic acid export membrane protein